MTVHFSLVKDKIDEVDPRHEKHDETDDLAFFEMSDAMFYRYAKAYNIEVVNNEIRDREDKTVYGYIA